MTPALLARPRRGIVLLLLPLFVVVTSVLLGHSGWNSDTGVYYFSGLSVIGGRGVSSTLGADTFTPGLPWISQEWLIGTLVALTGIDTPAYVLVKLVFAAAVCAAFALYAIDLEARGVGRVPILVAAIAIACAMPIGLRAYVLSYPLAVGFAMLVRRRDVGRWWALAIAVLWVNVHGSFLLAPVIVCVEIVTSLFERDPKRATSNCALLACVLAISLFANPFGWRLDEYAIRSLVPALHRAQYIDEWKPLDLFNEYPHGVDGVLAFSILGFVLARRLARTGLRGVLLFALTFALALHSARHTPYFYLLGTPVVLQSLQTYLGRAGARISSRSLAIALAVAVCATIAAAPVVARVANAGEHDRLILDAQPLVANLPARTHVADVRLVCTELRQCARAMWMSPHVKHMLDSRSDPFPLDAWDDFMAMRTTAPGWEKRLARWDVTDVLCSDEVPLCAAMAKLPSFRVLERSPDGRVVLYERAPRR